MKIQADVQNPDSLLLEIRNKVIRCDLYARWVSILDKDSLIYRRMIALNEYREVIDYDQEDLFAGFKHLIQYFTLEPVAIRRVYLHKKNRRFNLLESEAQLIEMDREMKGFKDSTGTLFSKALYNLNARDDYFRNDVLQKYEIILKEFHSLVNQTVQGNLF